MAVFDIKAHIDSLKTKYNIADEDLKASEVEGGFLRQDEFSRKQQALDRDKQAVRSKYDELTAYETYIQDLERTYGAREGWSDTFARMAQQQAPGQQQQQQVPPGLTA